MLVVIAHFACGGLVAYDAHRRGNDALRWGLAAAVVPPIFVPLYCAKRHLKRGESRVGGTTWVFCRSFAWLWTFVALIALASGSVADLAPAAVGLWLAGATIALAVGLARRDPEAVETGPTGPLEAEEAGAIDFDRAVRAETVSSGEARTAARAVESWQSGGVL